MVNFEAVSHDGARRLSGQAHAPPTLAEPIAQLAGTRPIAEVAHRPDHAFV